KGSVPFMAELLKHIDTMLKLILWLFQAIMVVQLVVEKLKF
ncbi:hypothetical protein SAN_0004, partial [Streptococcus agalactiae COH1]